MNKVVVTIANIRKHSTQIFKVLMVVIVLAGILFFWLGQDKPNPPSEKLSEQSSIYDFTKSVEDKSLWLFKAQNQLLEQQKTQEKLVQELEELKKTLKSQTEVESLKIRLEQLEEKTAHTAALDAPYSEQIEENTESFPQYTASHDNEEPIPPITSGIINGIFSETLNLSPNESKLPHIESFIPPGTYTKAVLLSGVDVSAGVSSQASPKPVLLRLIDKGSLPNKAFGNMKDCRVIAAAYGDLSSERAYMRLEKLSCVQPDGHVIVTDVDGYVNGEDGKNGLRGRVVIRDTAVLTRGFMGGLLSGLGKAVTQSYRSTSLSPFGAVSTSEAKGLDIFKQAGSQGMGDAFELMAKYNIQRAEQYQPIIQISAGREVDVVFHSGSQFGEKKVRLKEHKEPAASNNNLSSNNFYGD